jgi:hypothetical protein
MGEIDPDEYEDYEESLKAGTKAGRLKKRKQFPVSASGKVARKELVRSAKEKRAFEAEGGIRKRLSTFPDIDTFEGLKKAKIYVRWVKDSLSETQPILDLGDIEFRNVLPKVKAGGQHHQKNRTAVIAVHTPTLIGVRNEDERSAEQNRENAIKALYPALERHLELWKTLTANGAKVDIEGKVMTILKH